MLDKNNNVIINDSYSDTGENINTNEYKLGIDHSLITPYFSKDNTSVYNTFTTYTLPDGSI